MRIRTAALGLTSALAIMGATTLSASALTGTFTEVDPAVPDGFVSGADINDAGQTTGSAEFAGGEIHGFLRDADGTYTELLTLPAATYSQGNALNSAGDVVGGSGSIAALWPAAGGGPIDLGTLAGDTESFAEDINDAGWIVGTSRGAGGTRSWVRDPGDGLLVDIGTVPGGTTPQIRAINSAGVATGEVLVGGSFVGFTWTEAGGIVAMPLPDGETTLRPTAINDAGPVVGHVYVPGDDLYRTYVWDPTDGFTELTMDGYETSFAQSISDSGLVVGFVDNASDSSRSPAAWDLASGDATVFPLFAAGVFTSELEAANSDGLAVGITREGDDFDRTFIGLIAPDAVPAEPPAAVPVAAEPSFTG